VEVLSLEGSCLVRFVTTTQGWAELSRNHICVPDKWPFMIVELLVAEDGSVLMSTAEGIPKNTVKILQCQGLYYYDFEELPDTIVEAVIGHFKNLYKKLMRRVDTLLPASAKPQLILVHPPSMVARNR
jgi:hypothetical protein